MYDQLNGVAVVRDGNGQPVMQLVTRNRAGQFITPRYDYVWLGDQEPRGDSE